MREATPLLWVYLRQTFLSEEIEVARGQENSLGRKIARQAAKDVAKQKCWENEHFFASLKVRADRIECRLVEVNPVDYPQDEAELLRRHLISKIARRVRQGRPGTEVVWLPTISRVV